MTEINKTTGRSAVWQRLDIRGMDSCRVFADEEGWTVEGAAAFVEKGQPAHLAYGICCDQDWTSHRAQVRGWVGARNIDVALQQTPASTWTNHGQPLAEMAGLLDVDLGFTPASNTNAIRRLNLSVGQEIETTALLLDTDDWTVRRLRQVYRRLSSNTYRYASPMHGYEAVLDVDDFGMVINYPDLWKIARL
jgi:uncharacterized protein